MARITHRIFGSVFTKILAVILLTGLGIQMAVGVFFWYFRSEAGRPVSALISPTAIGDPRRLVATREAFGTGLASLGTVDARVVVDYHTPSYDPYSHMAVYPYPAHLSSGFQLPNGRDIVIRPIRPEDAEIEEFADVVSRTAKRGGIVLIPAFMLSELKSAFQIGFVIFLPALLIDLVISSMLMSMGMFMVPPVMISLPIKVLMFVLIDGWNIVVRSLVASFH